MHCTLAGSALTLTAPRIRLDGTAPGATWDGETLHLQGTTTNVTTVAQRCAGIVLLDAVVMVEGAAADWFLSTPAHSRRIATLAEVLPSANDAERSMWAGFGMPVPGPLPDDQFNTDGRWRRFSDIITLMSVGGTQGLLVAASGAPRGDLRLDVLVDGTRLRLLVTSVVDVELAPGESRAAQEAVLRFGSHDGLLRRLFDEWAATLGARTARGPLSGWCSWYHDGPQIAAGRVARIAQVAHDEQLPFDTIQIDDGFQRQVGDWATNAKFPDGWAPLVQSISAGGAMPGIWLAPLAVHETTAVFKDHPDWFQRDAAGDLLGSASNWGPLSRWLDPTHPGVQAWIRALLAEVRAAGFTYVKIDFNTVQEGARLHDRRVTRFQALRNLYALYREALGDESYLLACIGFNRAVVGLADAVRIGPDSAPLWRAAHPCCIVDCIRATGSTALANRVLFANDPDVTYTRPRGTLTTDEWRTWHGFVGLLGGAQLVSEPFDVVDQDFGVATINALGDGWQLTAEVFDAQPVIGANPWEGTCVEVFACTDGVRRSWYLTPGRCDLPASHERTARGWRVQAMLPVAETYEVKIDADPAGSGRRYATLFGSLEPWASTEGYQPLTAPLTATITAAGWRTTTELYRLVVPPAPETAIPLHGGSDPDHGEIGFTAVRPWGRFAVRQRWNPESAPRDLLVGDPGLGTCHVWSFWDRRSRGLHAQGLLLADVAPHAPVVLRFTPVDSTRPVIVGSTLHLAQGAAELTAVDCTDSTIDVTLSTAGTRSGALWLAWSGMLQLAGATGCDAALQRDGDLWRLDLRQRRGSQRLSLRFSC